MLLCKVLYFTATYTHMYTLTGCYITHRFDALLRQIVESDRLVGSDIFHLLNELSGTLYCHCGKYLLSHHTEVRIVYVLQVHVICSFINCCLLIVVSGSSMCDSSPISNGS